MAHWAGKVPRKIGDEAGFCLLQLRCEAYIIIDNEAGPFIRFLEDFGIMKHVEDIGVGKVMVAQGKITLRAIALGSCIGVAAYDAGKRIGGMAHVMLPGRAPDKTVEKTRYAANAIDEMIGQMIEMGSKPADIEVCLVGAGNVLERDDDTICESNIESVREILENKGIAVKASALGGTQRQSVSIDVERGEVWRTQGDGEKKLLWREG